MGIVCLRGGCEDGRCLRPRWLRGWWCERGVDTGATGPQLVIEPMSLCCRPRLGRSSRTTESASTEMMVHAGAQVEGQEIFLRFLLIDQPGSRSTLQVSPIQWHRALGGPESVLTSTSRNVRNRKPFFIRFLDINRLLYYGRTGSLYCSSSRGRGISAAPWSVTTWTSVWMYS